MTEYDGRFYFVSIIASLDAGFTERIEAILDRQEDWFRLSYGQYLVYSEHGQQAIAASFQPLINDGTATYSFVVRINPRHRAGVLPQKCLKWIERLEEE